MASAEYAVSAALMRRALVTIGVAAAFAILAAQLVSLGTMKQSMPQLAVAQPQQPRHAAVRPDIADRNGMTLATDVQFYGLSADPLKVLDADETARKLAAKFPVLNAARLRTKLKTKSRFIWIKRGLTPDEAAAVHNLGLPGLTLTEERGRYYPAGEGVAHLLGQTNVDNLGINGIESILDRKYGLSADAAPPADAPKLRTTFDLRLQYALRNELQAAQDFFGAKAAAGVLMEVNSGDVLALASLPDYDPNRRENALAPGRQNRVTADVYELGSVFKAMTVAMAIDGGFATPRDVYDVATPLTAGGYTLNDRHAHVKTATVEEILEHSYNLGAARLALRAGPERQQEFLRKLGLLTPLDTEIGMTATPLFPQAWRDVNTITVAYGHGISVTPLAFASAACTLVNGGYRVTPRFVAADGPAPRGERILRPQTSEAMRRMLRATVETGTGRQARVPGYAIGGKTGTAYKPEKGGYSKEVITSFFAAFPIDAPKYLLFVMLDEPKKVEGAKNNEAAYNAVESTGAILKRVIPILGIAPDSGAVLAETALPAKALGTPARVNAANAQ